MNIKAIRMRRTCAASGKHLEERKVYTVPAMVSVADAAQLVRIGAAEACEPEAEKPAKAGSGA